ncbi:MAG: carboxypeptidase regulatory-like domain-containing protein, partial [Spirochaetia bacterium]|nr:carboxypeptidase regulatory-like domain-containing protein [Spirochaetia bacterium]
EVVTTFAVLENKENTLELTNSMTGFGVIQGQVFYKTLDNPVSNHPIYMPTINSVVNLKKVKTDEKGNFLFTALLPGEYEIKASFAEELALSNSMITVKEGETTKIQIILNVKLPSTKTKY